MIALVCENQPGDEVDPREGRRRGEGRRGARGPIRNRRRGIDSVFIGWEARRAQSKTREGRRSTPGPRGALRLHSPRGARITATRARDSGSTKHSYRDLCVFASPASFGSLPIRTWNGERAIALNRDRHPNHSRASAGDQGAFAAAATDFPPRAESTEVIEPSRFPGVQPLYGPRRPGRMVSEFSRTGSGQCSPRCDWNGSRTSRTPS